MKNLWKYLLAYLSAILSGVLLYTSFPPIGISLIAWVGLVPILFSLNFIGYLHAFPVGFLMGAVLYILYMNWLNVVATFTGAAFFMMALYAGFFFGLFGILYTFITMRTKFPKVIVAPVLWVVIEYVRSNLFFLAIPLGLLAHSQYEEIPLIQIASFTSVYGITFIVVLVNAALTESIIYTVNRIRSINGKQQASPLPAVFSMTGAFLTVSLIYFWGYHQVQDTGNKTKMLLSVSLIQGNIPQHEKWNPQFRQKVMQQYSKLTMQASKENPDLIIWPETAIPGYLADEQSLALYVKNLSRTINTPLLVGSSSFAKMEKGGWKFRQDKNCAFLIDEQGNIINSYTKMRLLPFGEYLPLAGKFSWPRWLVPEYGSFIPGTTPTVFETRHGKFGVVICWENLFPDLFRTFVIRGSEFMVNLTNEAWFKKTVASELFLKMSVFRAVENRVTLLRCANTGISSLIDPFGRIKDRIRDAHGNDIMVEGTLTIRVPESKGQTFYTRNGDAFAVFCSLIGGFIFLLSLLPLRVRRQLRLTWSDGHDK
jgi:apolipoprotein N-acyltransferase